MPKKIYVIAQKNRRRQSKFTTNRQRTKNKRIKLERADHKFIRVLLKTDSSIRHMEHEKQIYMKVMERHRIYRQNFILCQYCWYFFPAAIKDIHLYGKYAVGVKQLLVGYCNGGMMCFSDWCEKIISEKTNKGSSVALPGYLTKAKRRDWDCPFCRTKRQ